jgi:hypothetical protein
MKLKPLRLRLWRAVEAQHHVSTLRLVDNDPEQHEALERVLESSKPAPAAGTQRLAYLLATPFRYPSPYGSRFRGPHDPGVFYGAEHRRTACAELGYWRWHFAQASEGLKALAATAHTLFQAGVDTQGIDLRRPPFVRDRAQWTHAENYGPTQELGRQARAAQAGAIVYESVRDPEHAACAAVLTPQALKPARPLAQETWFLTVTEQGALWTRERVEFVFQCRKR